MASYDPIYLQHVIFVILRNEGSIGGSSGNYSIIYNNIEKGAPYEGIGLRQWSLAGSFTLLKGIYDNNGWLGTSPPNNIRSAIENNNKWSSYKWYQYESDTAWVREYLDKEESRAYQISLIEKDTISEMDMLYDRGITDLKALGWCTDVSNQYGPGWGNTFGAGRFKGPAHNSLDAARNFMSGNATNYNTYISRRNWTYEYFRDANLSGAAPIALPVSDLDSEGDQKGGESLPNEIDSGGFWEYSTKVISERQTNILADTFAFRGGGILVNDFFTCVPVLNLGQFVLPAIDFTYVTYNEIETMYREWVRDDQDRLEDQAEIDRENITDLPEAIQKVVAKALSYEADSIPYSQAGPRDMIVSGDCSCFVDICFKAAGLSIGGWTGAQYQTAKDRGWVVIEGGRNVIPQIVSQARAGDFVLLSRDASNSSHSSGNGSHVGLMTSSTNFRHQGTSSPVRKGFGPTDVDLSDYANNYVSSYQAWTLVRPLG